MDFSMELFLLPDEPVTKFVHANGRHFGDGSDFAVHHKLDTIDLASE